MQDDWVTGVLGSEGIIGHDYELPLMQERIGGPYDLPIIGGDAPPQSVAMAGAPLYIRHGDVEFWHQRPAANRKLRSNLEAISGAMYEIECAGYEVAAATLDAYAGAMLDGWPAGSENIETGFSLGSIVSSVTRAVGRAAQGVVKNNPVARVVQKAIAPISRTVSSAAQTLVNGVRKYNPVALAKVAVIKAKALAGDIKNSVIFKTLSAVPCFRTCSRYSRSCPASERASARRSVLPRLSPTDAPSTKRSSRGRRAPFRAAHWRRWRSTRRGVLRMGVRSTRPCSARCEHNCRRLSLKGHSTRGWRSRPRRPPKNVATR